MTDFRSLELFYWAAELNSFSRAAERANTTQPSVSQRIAALEAELGVKLFERNARAISLTSQGRKLFQYAERFLQLRSEMLMDMGSAVAMKGVVRLGVSETIAQTWLNQFIKQAHSIYPNIVIDLTVDVTPTMRALLARGDLDLAFMLGPVDDQTMASSHLCAYPLAIVASPDMDVGTEPLSIAQLRNFPIITYPKSTAPYPRLRDALNDPSLPPPRVFGISSLATMIEMTLNKIGVTLIPPVVVQRELQDSRLRIVRTDLRLPDLTFMATFPLSLSGGLSKPLAELAQQAAQSHHQASGRS